MVEGFVQEQPNNWLKSLSVDSQETSDLIYRSVDIDSVNDSIVFGIGIGFVQITKILKNTLKVLSENS